MYKIDEIYNYIEERHLDDGGYFFARITPSSGLDTYLAVKTLKLLKRRPKKSESIIHFWENEEKEGNIDDLTGIYFSSQTYRELGYSLRDFQKYKTLLFSVFQNKESYSKKAVSLKGESFGLYDTGIASVYVDMLEGESKNIYYLTRLLVDLGIDFNKQTLVDYVLSRRNSDGGFGSIKGSEVATTYYCLEVLNLISRKIEGVNKIRDYLLHELARANYLEEYHWSIIGLHLLGEHIPDRDRVLSFVEACYRSNGGFSRSQFIGISSIEYTYQAVSTLKVLKAI